MFVFVEQLPAELFCAVAPFCEPVVLVLLVLLDVVARAVYVPVPACIDLLVLH